MLVEDKAAGPAVIRHLQDAIPGIIAVNPEGGKMSRMMAAAPEFQANNWFFDRTGAWTNRAIDQLCLFPNAKNDDIVDSVSQAAIWLQSHSYELGLVDLFKKLGSGVKKMVRSVQDLLTRKPGAAVEESKPVIVTRDQAKEYTEGHPPPLCPHPECKNPCTFLQRDHEGQWHIYCRQCGRVDGKDLPGAEKPGHIHRWRVIPGGYERCDDCTEQRPIANLAPPPTNGVSRAQYAALQSVDSKVGRSFGRFGW